MYLRLLCRWLKNMGILKKKARNGYTMLGIVTQWAIREQGLTGHELILYLSIADRSFARRKRWCYLKYEDTGITNRNTIKKTITSLVEKGIIFYKRTYKPDSGHRSMNEYKILQPMGKIRDFMLSEEHKEEVAKIEEYDEWSKE